jgi:hypothetical protein
MVPSIMNLLAETDPKNYVQLFWWEKEVNSPWGVVFHLPTLTTTFEQTAITVLMKEVIPGPVPFYIEQLGSEVPQAQKDQRLAVEWHRFLEWLSPFHTPQGDGFMSFPFLDLYVLAKIYQDSDFFLCGKGAAIFLKNIVANANRVYLENPKVLFSPYKDDSMGWAVDYNPQDSKLWISIPRAAQNENTLAALSRFEQALKNGIPISVECLFQG